MPSSGGILQISARGVQDQLISGSPTSTMWASRWSRFAPFAVDDEVLELSAAGWSTTSSVTLARYGDLIHRLTLELTLPPLKVPDTLTGTDMDGAVSTICYYSNAIGFAAIESCEFEVGGHSIEQLYSEYCFMLESLAGQPGNRLGVAIGKVNFSSTVDEDLAELASSEQKLFVPLPFFFSKYAPQTYGLAIPLVAMTHHEVRLKLKTRASADVTCCAYKTLGTEDEWSLSSVAPYNATTNAAMSVTDLKIRVIVSFVYLGDAERSAAANSSHTLLINTAQRQTFPLAANTSTLTEFRLTFNHPSNALIWALRPLDFNTQDGRRRFSCGFKDFFDFTHKVDDANYNYGNVVNPCKIANLKLNSSYRYPESCPIEYFRHHVPYTSWRTTPDTDINSMVFSLQGFEWQPTSTLNYSRLDNAHLTVMPQADVKQSEIILFCTAYNAFVVQDGLGGTKWAN